MKKGKKKDRLKGGSATSRKKSLFGRSNVGSKLGSVSMGLQTARKSVKSYRRSSAISRQDTPLYHSNTGSNSDEEIQIDIVSNHSSISS